MNARRWTEAGWDGADRCPVRRKSDFRCGMPGPWTLRVRPNGEMAHRDHMVCRRGKMWRGKMWRGKMWRGKMWRIRKVWLNARRPIPRS